MCNFISFLFSKQLGRRDYTRAVQMADFYFAFLRLCVRAVWIPMLDVHYVSRNCKCFSSVLSNKYFYVSHFLSSYCAVMQLTGCIACWETGELQVHVKEHISSFESSTDSLWFPCFFYIGNSFSACKRTVREQEGKNARPILFVFKNGLISEECVHLV
jgi:hypothetical protein